MQYEKDKKYTVKYITDKFEEKEQEITPEKDMSKPEMIMKLKENNKDFFKLVENKSSDDYIELEDVDKD